VDIEGEEADEKAYFHEIISFFFAHVLKFKAFSNTQ